MSDCGGKKDAQAGPPDSCSAPEAPCEASAKAPDGPLALFGGMIPIVAVPVSLAQGFGKRK